MVTQISSTRASLQTVFFTRNTVYSDHGKASPFVPGWFETAKPNQNAHSPYYSFATEGRTRITEDATTIRPVLRVSKPH